ncbi:MAG: Bug family tripartite tricarboxylate transporter substrate binding protein, partial [Bradyrhizobium sp.]
MRTLAFALVFTLALGLASGAATGPTLADDYPSHPIRLIVPFAAGGAADSVARIVGKRVGDALGQTVVVEDRGGGGGIIGTEVVKNSDADGYTLLLGQSGPISINPGIYPKLPYNPEKDFVPISMTTSYPYILVVNPSLGVKTVGDLVALARSKPGQLNYGTAGVGASNHLLTELFDSKAGIKMTHIPYRGTSLAVADLIAGQVQVVFADPVSALAHVKGGTLIALGVTSKA